MSKLKSFDVMISRVHKSSPYNVSGYLYDVKAMKIEDVINLKEVDNEINKTFEKKLIVQIYENSSNKINMLEFNIEKLRAVI